MQPITRDFKPKQAADIPDDIWEIAWDHTDAGEMSFTEAVECVARAVMAERKRCAAIAETSPGTTSANIANLIRGEAWS